MKQWMKNWNIHNLNGFLKFENYPTKRKFEKRDCRKNDTVVKMMFRKNELSNF
jgi:hypothetical protein